MLTQLQYKVPLLSLIPPFHSPIAPSPLPSLIFSLLSSSPPPGPSFTTSPDRLSLLSLYHPTFPPSSLYLLSITYPLFLIPSPSSILTFPPLAIPTASFPSSLPLLFPLYCSLFVSSFLSPLQLPSPRLPLSLLNIGVVAP